MNILITKQQLLEVKNKLNPLVKKALIGKVIKPVIKFQQGLVPVGESVVVSESPDVIQNGFGDRIAHWSEGDGLAFGFVGNKAYIAYNNGLFFDEESPIPEQKKEELDTIHYKTVSEFQKHSGIGKFYNFLGYDNTGNLNNRSDFQYPGRLWFYKDIISFWEYPPANRLPQLLSSLSNEMIKIYGHKFDLTKYRIEVNPNNEWKSVYDEGKLIPISDYVGSQNFDINTIHTLPSDEKRNTPQMKAARDADAERLANKFSDGNVSQSEWNAAKNKYRGESKTFKITDNQLNEIKKCLSEESIIYTAIFVEKGDLINKYKPVYSNVFCHHSTIQFKPETINNLPIGEKIKLKIIGRLTTDKVDVLLVDNKFSNAKHPHITLSTADGVKPFESNGEIENNLNKIFTVDDYVYGVVGYFNGSKDVINENININVTTGDTIMTGKFKNKKTVVKSIDKDKHGMPTINGKQATTFRTIKEGDVTKNDFRLSLKHLLNKPNTKDGPGLSFFSDEQLINKFVNAFKYKTSRGIEHTETVYVYKSKNGSRYLASDDNLESVDAAAFVNNENVLTGIITDWGMTGVGIGKNLLNLIRSNVSNLKIDDLQSAEGKRLFKEGKDYVYGNFNGETIEMGNEDFDAIPFVYYNNKVFVGYNPILGENYKDAGYEDDNGENEYPNFHADITDFYKFIHRKDPNYRVELPTRRNTYDYLGRIWYDREVISFYKYPEDKNKMKEILSLLNKELNNVYGETFDFSNYIVDTTDDGLVGMNDYIGSSNASDEVMNSPHLMSPENKKNSLQLKAVRDYGNEKLANKFTGETSQAEWNAAKNKYRGESVENEVDNQVIEATESDVNLSSFKPQKQLNTKFFNDNNDQLNSNVRRRLLKIADDFFEYINVDMKFCKDVIFLGSLANYNWSKYSDVDLHMLVDFKKINADIELVRDYFDSKKKLWSQEHPDLKIYNFPIELYIQDVNEENAATGVYSLEKNKWIKKPSLIDGDDITQNQKKIKLKASDLMTKIDDLKTEFDVKKISDEELIKISNVVKKLYDKIKKLRKSGLETEDGEMSIGNIVFKVLRRTDYLSKLIDLKASTYDKINTLK